MDEWMNENRLNVSVWVKVLAAKPADLSHSPEPWWTERNGFPKSSSLFHVHVCDMLFPNKYFIAVNTDKRSLLASGSYRHKCEADLEGGRVPSTGNKTWMEC